MKLSTIYTSFMYWDLAIMENKGYALEKGGGMFYGYTSEGIQCGWFNMATKRGYVTQC